MQFLTNRFHSYPVFLTLLLAFLGIFGCKTGRNKVKAPIEAPTKQTDIVDTSIKPMNPTHGGRSILLGWFCPDFAAGRPGIRPLWANNLGALTQSEGQPQLGWTDDKTKLAAAIGTRQVKQFSVLGWLGRRAGSFSVAGLATDSSGALAIGAYLGSSTCETSMLGRTSVDDLNCKRVIKGCALALAVLEDAGGFEARPYEEDPEHMDYTFFGACEIGDVLVMDTDGDGVMERFSLGVLRSENAAPVELASVKSNETCEVNFAAVVSEDLVRLATMDIDGDGRGEVLYRRGANEFLLFGAPNHPGRLELLGRYVLTAR